MGLTVNRTLLSPRVQRVEALVSQEEQKQPQGHCETYFVFFSLPVEVHKAAAAAAVVVAAKLCRLALFHAKK